MLLQMPHSSDMTLASAELAMSNVLLHNHKAIFGSGTARV
jgi:hypothetical protein